MENNIKKSFFWNTLGSGFAAINSLFFLIIVMFGQFFSLKIPQILAKKRYNNSPNLSSNGSGPFNKTKMSQNIFIVVMCLIVVFSPCGVGIY